MFVCPSHIQTNIILYQGYEGNLVKKQDEQTNRKSHYLGTFTPEGRAMAAVGGQFASCPNLEIRVQSSQTRVYRLEKYSKISKLLERALRALASSSGGAACPGATQGQPRGSTSEVRG